eukprot:symbB.v1.2.034204.t1/scaffold4375.1/size40526/4
MRPCQNCGKHHNLGQPGTSFITTCPVGQAPTPQVKVLGNSSSVGAGQFPAQADQSLHSTRSSTPLQRADSRSSVLKASATLSLKK